jgi:hypothetical protein
MGSPLYWRPVSRQLYVLALGPALVAHPIVAPLVHAALLAALFAVLYRIARLAYTPPVAAALAAFPIGAEPVRVLLGWPSGGEYLLAALFAALAVREALRDRLATGALAALLAALSHEAGLLVLAALPLVAWRRTHSVRRGLAWLGAALAVAVVWAVGFAVSRARGRAAAGDRRTAGRGVGRRARARSGAARRRGRDTVDPGPIGAAWLAWTALVISTPRGAQRRHRSGAVSCSAGSRGSRSPRACGARAAGLERVAHVLPGLRLAFVVVGLAAAVARASCPHCSRWGCSPSCSRRAPALVAAQPPSRARLSFARLVRLQRTVSSTRRARSRAIPGCRAGRAPLLDDSRAHRVRLRGPRAAAVWYQDSTISWSTFDGDPSHGGELDALVEYDVPKASPATVIEREAMRLFAAGLFAVADERWAAADSLFAAAAAARTQSWGLLSSLAHQRALLAVRSGALGAGRLAERRGPALAGPARRWTRSRPAWRGRAVTRRRPIAPSSAV